MVGRKYIMSKNEYDNSSYFRFDGRTLDFLRGYDDYHSNEVNETNKEELIKMMEDKRDQILLDLNKVIESVKNCNNGR